jgi:hypothetical protein
MEIRSILPHLHYVQINITVRLNIDSNPMAVPEPQNLLNGTVEKERKDRFEAVALLKLQNLKRTVHKARKDRLKAKFLQSGHAAAVSPQAAAQAVWKKRRLQVSPEEYARLRRIDRNSKLKAKRQ